MNSSEPNPALKETLQKIGRNLVNFQRMEAMLKFVISHSRFQGTSKTLKSSHESNVQAVFYQTMGNLIKNLFPAVYSEHSHSDKFAEEIEEAWVSFSFKHDADVDFVKQRKNALEQIVEERNILVHQMLSKFDLQSIESCRELGKLLDEQAERVEPEFEYLRSLVDALITGRKAMLEIISNSQY